MIDSIFKVTRGIMKLRGATTGTLIGDGFGSLTAAIRAAAQIGNDTGAADFNSGATTAQTIRVVLVNDGPPGGDRTASASVNANNVSTQISAVGTSTIAFQLTGTWSGSFIVEGSLDGSTWLNIGAQVPGGGTQFSVSTNSIWRINSAGFSLVRLRTTAWTSGTATLLFRASLAMGAVEVRSDNQASFNANVRIKDGSGTALTSTLIGSKQSIDVNVVRHNFNSRSDTFTGTTSGTTVDVSTAPVKNFGLQVTATGSVTSWTVVLEASLDNSNFTTVLTHTNATPGTGQIIWSGANNYPAMYFRTRCTAITLGTGTNVVAVALGSA